MTDNKIQNAGNLISQANAAQTVQPTDPAAAESASANSAEIGQQEFLTLLVNQLQHQDPLDPMDPTEFSTQLAQFTQVEQLLQINDKLDNLAPSAEGPASVASMASFLGHEVALDTSTVTMTNGSGPNVLFSPPADAQSARIDFRGQDGRVVASVEVDNLENAKEVVNLRGVDIPDGEYDLQVVAVSSDGRFVRPNFDITGTVEGFVVEPEPALVVNGEQISLADIKTVFSGS